MRRGQRVYSQGTHPMDGNSAAGITTVSAITTLVNNTDSGASSVMFLCPWFSYSSARGEEHHGYQRIGDLCSDGKQQGVKSQEMLRLGGKSLTAHSQVPGECVVSLRSLDILCQSRVTGAVHRRPWEALVSGWVPPLQLRHAVSSGGPGFSV